MRPSSPVIAIEYDNKHPITLFSELFRIIRVNAMLVNRGLGLSETRRHLIGHRCQQASPNSLPRFTENIWLP